MSSNTGLDSATATIDSQINHTDQLNYWSAQTADVNGMLGGYPQVSRIDLQGSRNFIAKIRRLDRQHQAATQTEVNSHGKSPAPQPAKSRLNLAVDCGAGIGRITQGLLLSLANRVDIVEPVKKFTDAIETASKDEAGKGKIGRIFNVGLEEWEPKDEYDLIWIQWCVGHLGDKQMVEFLQRASKALAKIGEGQAGGMIMVKENLSTETDGSDIFDEQDSSVTRSDDKFKAIFEEAGLQIVRAEIQAGFPRELYPVKMYALRPM